MLSVRRVQSLVVIGVLAAVSLGIALLAFRAWSLFVYAHERSEAYDLVAQLPERRPEKVDTEAWEVATSWAITAYANVCFSAEHVPIDELRRFRVDVEKRLAADVDLMTIDWIWQRLAETGSHGQQYRNRFEPIYREEVYAALDEQ
jgi:hypothetical protein